MERLKIEHLLAGEMSGQIEEALSRLTADVIARPGLKKARRLTLSVEIVPLVDQVSQRNYPEISVELKTAIPGSKGMGVRGIAQGNQILINPGDMEDAPGQLTIEDELADQERMRAHQRRVSEAERKIRNVGE